VKVRVCFTEEQRERKVVSQLRNGLNDPEMRALFHVHIGAGNCRCDEEDVN
jgi:hypothetical protein